MASLGEKAGSRRKGLFTIFSASAGSSLRLGSAESSKISRPLVGGGAGPPGPPSKEGWPPTHP